MTIAKRVGETIEQMAQNDPEGALLPISSAIDATATKQFQRRGKKSYKDFLHENLELITKAALGTSIQNINLKYNHPELEVTANDVHPIQDILYHVVRCALTHFAELPETLRFVDEQKFRVEQGLLVLPASLIYGFVVAVVVCPVNSDQSLPDAYGLNVGGTQVKLNDFWGKRQKFERIYAQARAI